MNEEQLRAELDAVYRSISWRLTSPLRWTSFYLKKIINKIKRTLISTILWIFKKPFMVSFCKYILNYFPSIKIKLRNKYNAIQNNLNYKVDIVEIVAQQDVKKIDGISTSASEIFGQLQNAIVKHNSNKASSNLK